jgi:hypothetical protein
MGIGNMNVAALIGTIMGSFVGIGIFYPLFKVICQKAFKVEIDTIGKFSMVMLFTALVGTFISSLTQVNYFYLLSLIIIIPIKYLMLKKESAKEEVR